MDGIVKASSGKYLVLNSGDWKLSDEIKLIKERQQLIDMSLIYNSKKEEEKFNLEDVRFIHHFANGEVSKRAILKVKQEIEYALSNKTGELNSFNGQKREDYISQLLKSLPHINKHLKDAGFQEVIVDSDENTALNIVVNSRNGTILELNQVANRTLIKFVAHVIHEDEKGCNANGLNWQEEYVKQNMHSAKGMPIKYEPNMDGEPEGHGYFTSDNDGNIVSYYSEIAGYVEDVEISEIPGTNKRGLICTGYIDNVVHKKLSDWLKLRYLENKVIDTSVEILGRRDDEGNQLPIVYKSGYTKSLRTPTEYDYIGSAIIGEEPADTYATVMEVNSKEKINFKEEAKLNYEEMYNELKEKFDKYKESHTIELNTKENLETITVELNSLKEERDTLVAEKESMTTELNSLKEFKEKAEKEIKFESFTKELKEEFSKEVLDEFNEKIEALKENVNEVELNSIKIELYKKELELEKNRTSKEEDDMFVLNITNDANNEDEDVILFEE